MSILLLVRTLVCEEEIIDALIQLPAVEARHLDTLSSVSLILGTISAGLLILSAPLMADMFREPAITGLLRALAVIPFLKSLTVVPKGVVRRSLDLKTFTLRTTVSTSFSGAVAISMALTGWGVWSLVFYNIANAFAELVFFRLAGPYKARFAFDSSAFRETYPFIWRVAGVKILSISDTQISRALIGFWLGPAQLGMFVFSRSLQALIANFLVAPFNRAIMPSFARIQHDAALVQRLFDQSVQLSSLVVVPSFVGLGIVSPIFVPYVFGPKWVDAVPLVQIACAAGVLAPLVWINNQLLRGLGHVRILLSHTALSCLATLILVWLAAPYGVLTIAMALAAKSALLMPVRLFTTAKLCGISYGASGRVFLQTVAASCLMGAAVGLGTASLSNQLSSLTMLLVSVSLGVLVYFLLILAIARPFCCVALSYLLRPFSSDERTRQPG